MPISVLVARPEDRIAQPGVPVATARTAQKSVVPSVKNAFNAIAGAGILQSVKKAAIDAAIILGLASAASIPLATPYVVSEMTSETQTCTIEESTVAIQTRMAIRPHYTRPLFGKSKFVWRPEFNRVENNQIKTRECGDLNNESGGRFLSQSTPYQKTFCSLNPGDMVRLKTHFNIWTSRREISEIGRTIGQDTTVDIQNAAGPAMYPSFCKTSGPG